MTASENGVQADSDLAARAIEGQEDACRALMERHRAAVYRLIHAQIDDADAALDVTQDSFIAAFANLHRYDRTRPFRFWIMRIALNKCRDWRRRRAVRSFFFRAKPIEESVHVADDSPGPELEIDRRRELARARRAIDLLPENLRSVLLLRTIEGMSQAEVAALLAISEKAVETRLYRARAKLTAMLRESPATRV
ncbi:RNA polymerase sigma factor [Sphingomonas sp. SRS2]|uniref:RNA polymerase sigma factor n=1 Tax=Sphingomonas sp. SRS2 TaxID=133190 RepID=UPI0006183F5F|nr:sigma-70 family RNA polymerase sigma factor [Sphingomonas sp. SRS2]KKC24774.1 FecI sigma-24 factor [Sphingomonas sp. SRS2]